MVSFAAIRYTVIWLLLLLFRGEFFDTELKDVKRL